jgi:hypothetical protein
MSDFPSPPPPPPPGQPPPGYVAYGTPAATGFVKPVKGIATALVVLMVISILASLAMLLTSFVVADEAEDFADDPSRFDEEVGSFLAAAGVAGLVSVAALVLLIIWSFRIASNIRQRDALTWKPGLTIVAWIFSCLLGILPFLMLREHWKKSDRGGTDGAVTPLIPLWLVLTILSGIAGAVASGVRSVSGGGFGQENEDLAEQLSDQLGFSVAQGVLSIAATVVLIVIVRQLTERHARYTGEA